MKVAGEVEVDVLHRQHLRVAAACRTAFESEARAERWLTQRCYGVFAYVVEGLHQAHAHCGFAYTCFGGGDGGDEYQIVLCYFLFVDEAQRYFCHIWPVVVNIIGGNAERFGYCVDFYKFSLFCYLYVAFHQSFNNKILLFEIEQ